MSLSTRQHRNLQRIRPLLSAILLLASTTSAQARPVDDETRRQIADSDRGFSEENWLNFAELGWLSVPFAEEFGGFGGGAIDTMVIMEEFGKGLVIEPYLATVLLFGALIDKGGNKQLQEELMAGIIDGSIQGAFAYLERQSRWGTPPWRPHGCGTCAC